MKSLYAMYLKERENKDVVEDDKGFASYSFPFETTVYIEDIYVLPQYRKKGIASSYADRIAIIARERGCKWMMGSVDPRAQSAATSRQVLLAYGMTPVIKTENFNKNLDFFVKEI